MSTRIIGATSLTAAISRHECMLSMGVPTSTARTPRRAAEMGPMVLPHGVSLRELKYSGSDIDRAARGTERRSRGTIRCVRLIDVHLDHRTRTEHRAMLFVVLVGVIRVHCVRHVSRDQ